MLVNARLNGLAQFDLKRKTTMQVRFHGRRDEGWYPVLATVRDEAEFHQLTRITDGVAPIEHRTVWEDTGLPTGVMQNFCLLKFCQECGGRTA